MNNFEERFDLCYVYFGINQKIIKIFESFDKDYN
jgi:hypothetical protein